MTTQQLFILLNGVQKNYNFTKALVGGDRDNYLVLARFLQFLDSLLINGVSVTTIFSTFNVPEAPFFPRLATLGFHKTMDLFFRYIEKLIDHHLDLSTVKSFFDHKLVDKAEIINNLHAYFVQEPDVFFNFLIKDLLPAWLFNSTLDLKEKLFATMDLMDATELMEACDKGVRAGSQFNNYLTQANMFNEFMIKRDEILLALTEQKSVMQNARRELPVELIQPKSVNVDISGFAAIPLPPAVEEPPPSYCSTPTAAAPHLYPYVNSQGELVRPIIPDKYFSAATLEGPLVDFGMLERVKEKNTADEEIFSSFANSVFPDPLPPVNVLSTVAVEKLQVEKEPGTVSQSAATLFPQPKHREAKNQQQVTQPEKTLVPVCP